jgi:hypothetical protein
VKREGGSSSSRSSSEGTVTLVTGKYSTVCTWAQEERPADLHMAQPNVPVSKTGHIPPARLFRGVGKYSTVQFDTVQLLGIC